METSKLKKELKFSLKVRLETIKQNFEMGLLTPSEMVKQKETEKLFTKNMLQNL
tara:strand:- start:2399 stop:2560 length:162 start_codon:yes stop_codon:yes gene_type:complete